MHCIITSGSQDSARTCFQVQQLWTQWAWWIVLSITNIGCPALGEDDAFLRFLYEAYSCDLLWPSKCDQNWFPVKLMGTQIGHQKAGGGTASFPRPSCYRTVYLWQWLPLSMTAIPSGWPILRGSSSRWVPITLFPVPDSSGLETVSVFNSF